MPDDPDGTPGPSGGCGRLGSAMLMGAAVLLVLLAVPLLGGRLSRLAELPVRGTGLLVAALGLQVLAIEVLTGNGPAHRVLHVASYALAAGFVWANRRLPGVIVLGVGGALNLTAIAANDGVMPAGESAMRFAGVAPTSEAFVNSAPLPDAKLAFLGDVLAVPAGVPFANVFSVGDVLIVAGAAVLVHVTCRARRGEPAAALA